MCAAEGCQTAEATPDSRCAGEGDGAAGMRGETYVLADASLREELEQLELAQRAEAEHRVVERRDLLDRDLAPGRPVDGRAHDAVRALADDIEHLVLRACAGAARADAAEPVAGWNATWVATMPYAATARRPSSSGKMAGLFTMAQV